MIPIAKPLLDEDEAEAAAAVVRSGWLSQGAQVAGFEVEFADLVGAPYACAVSNCTTGLHLAMLAAEIGPGHEVVTVSHSFIASANVIRQCGAIPVFVDIDPANFNLDPARLEAAITPRTRAILCVHQIGMPCDMAAILAVARRHGLIVLEDAACAIGSQILWDGTWSPIGAPLGDAACFSFHPRKVITTGEGGMLTTRHAEWDAKFRLLRQHGMSVPDTVRHGASTVTFEEYPVSGYNYRMTDMQAAVGRAQLRRLPHIVSRRRSLAERYAAILHDVAGLTLPREPDWARSNWQSYCVGLPGGADQRTVMQAMLDRGVASRRGIMCAHLEAAFADAPRPHALPHSERAHRRSILLPLFAQMTEVEQDAVAAALRDALATASCRPRAAA